MERLYDALVTLGCACIVGVVGWTVGSILKHERQLVDLTARVRELEGDGRG